MQFKNTIEIVVRSGETGEVLHQYEKDNAISDDFLCPSRGRIYVSNSLQPFNNPWCFLLPDGANWTGFTYDRTNPWCPYACTNNRVGDTNANDLYAAKTYFAPFAVGNPSNKHKLFYSWNALPINLQLKAVGLTGLQEEFYAVSLFGIADNATVFVPESLVILPASIAVRGRNATVANSVATQTPDILEVSYFLSIVGVS